MTVFEVVVWPSEVPAGRPRSVVLMITASNAAGALRKARRWYPGCLCSTPEPCCPYGDPECPAPGTPVWEGHHLDCSPLVPQETVVGQEAASPGPHETVMGEEAAG